MNTAAHEMDTTPWYRQFWPWFLIALPAATVVACAVTIYIAISRPHQLVVDDYTRMDAINEAKFAAISTARARKMNAEIQIDQATGVVSVQLRESTDPVTGVGPINLVLAHPSRPGDDQSLVLVEIDAGVYRGQLATALSGNRYVEIQPADESQSTRWRLSGQLTSTTGVSYLAPQ